MKYYRHIYLTEGLEKKKDKIIQKLESNKFQISIHLLVQSGKEKTIWSL